MLVKENPPETTLKSISDQIAYMVAGLLDQRSPRPGSVQLRESFAVWRVNLPTDSELPLEDADLAIIETDYWHHQILFDGKPSAFARSKVLPDGRAEVCEVAISPLARKIDDAIEWVESAERPWADSDSVQVRLLTLPQLLIYTFWMVEPQKIYVIDAFPEFVNLRQGQLLEQEKLLAALHEDLQSQKTPGA